MYCDGVGGGKIQHVSNVEMQRRIDSGKDVEHYYTLVEWEEKYKDSVGDFITRTIPAMKELGSPEDVRLVFWFDN